jgi:hypothetical protein
MFKACSRKICRLKERLNGEKKNKSFISEWKQKIEDLRLRSFSENWDQDKFEMEVVQCIPNQLMKEVFIFSKNYIARHKVGKFRHLMATVYEEIIQYGVVEPSRLNSIKKAIEGARRKI